MIYHYAITNLQGDLWFILKSPTERHVPAESDAIDKACGWESGDMNYHIKDIAQIDFETYQAFGIKEIKL